MQEFFLNSQAGDFMKNAVWGCIPISYLSCVLFILRPRIDLHKGTIFIDPFCALQAFEFCLKKRVWYPRQKDLI
jgi:hypothetical protein